MSTQKVRPDRGFAERQEFRQRRRMRNRKIGAYAMVAAIVAIAVVAIAVVRRTDVPGPGRPSHADRRSRHLRPGRGPDRLRERGSRCGRGPRSQLQPGLWAVDPNGPSDTTEGPSVADDVASTLVRLDLGEDALPPGWLRGRGRAPRLVERRHRAAGHALERAARAPTTSSTRMEPKPAYRTSPGRGRGDGGDLARRIARRVRSQGLAVVDIDGGRAVKLPYPAGGEPLRATDLLARRDADRVLSRTTGCGW